MALNFLNNGYFAGKVGIGTESPNAKLEVNSAITFSTIDTFGQLVVKAASGSTGDMLNIGVDTANSATFIQANDRGVGTIPLSLQRYGGYVGIGTISPTTPLSIESSGSDEFIKIENTATYTGLWMNDSGTNNGWLVLSGYTDAVSLGDFAIREYGVQTSLTIKQTTGNVGIGTTSPSEKLTLQLDAQNQAFSGKNGTDYLWFLRNEAGAGARQSGRFQLMDTDVTTVNIESASNRNTYFNAGNVGIGTTSPDLKLDVTHATDGEYVATFQNTGANLELKLGVTSTSYLNIQGQQINNSAAFNISLQADGGNVGINTTIPTQKLHVVGNARVTGAYYDSNNSPGTANQVLVSTVTGTDWVDGSGSSIIGGPYLPLAGGTMTGAIIQNGGNIDFSDGRSANFGNGDDLQIYHDGSNSYISDTGTGDLYLLASDNVYFQTYGSGKRWITLNENASVDLFYNDSKKFETTSTGISVTGQITTTGTSPSVLFNETDVTANWRNRVSSGSYRVQYASDGTTFSDYFVLGASANTVEKDTTFAGDIKIGSALLSNQENTDVDTGTEAIASVVLATYTAAFFDFVIKKGTNVRSGTVYACHDGTSVAFTETSTQDLGDTSDVTLNVVISTIYLQLQATTTSDDWSVKSLIRAI